MASDLAGRVVLANRKARDMLGLSPDDLARGVAMADHLRTEHDDMAGMIERTAGMTGERPVAMTIVTGDMTGARIITRARGMMPEDGSGPLAVFVLDEARAPHFEAHTALIRQLNRELARQHDLKEELNAALKTERYLHGELVHRVKNNLAMLDVLIRSRRKAAESDEVRDVLDEMSLRCRAIALVHELLDRKEEIEIVDASELLEELCELMQRAICPPGVSLEHELERFMLHVEDATPLCLLVNELVTNAVKHAFGDRPEGTIRLVFKRNGQDKLELRVGDDGRGGVVAPPAAPEARPAGAGGGHGRGIVAALSRQLGGTLDVIEEGGTEYVLIFRPERSFEEAAE